MASYRELMQDVVNASKADRIALGKKSLDDAIQILIDHDISAEDTTRFIKGLLSVFVSADRECSYEEYELVCEITGIKFSEEEFYEMTNGGSDPEIIQALDEVIDTLSVREKAAFCLFGLAIMASDEELTPEEQALFIRLSE